MRARSWAGLHKDVPPSSTCASTPRLKFSLANNGTDSDCFLDRGSECHVRCQSPSWPCSVPDVRLHFFVFIHRTSHVGRVSFQDSCCLWQRLDPRTRARPTAASGVGSRLRCWARITHTAKWWNGSHATFRTSCPVGRGSSTLPLVTAGAAGAQLALIRPVSSVRFRGLQSAVSRRHLGWFHFELAWSVGVSAARRFGKAEDRVQFPDGPLRMSQAPR